MTFNISKSLKFPSNSPLNLHIILGCKYSFTFILVYILTFLICNIKTWGDLHYVRNLFFWFSINCLWSMFYIIYLLIKIFPIYLNDRNRFISRIQNIMLWWCSKIFYLLFCVCVIVLEKISYIFSYFLNTLSYISHFLLFIFLSMLWYWEKSFKICTLKFDVK